MVEVQKWGKCKYATKKRKNADNSDNELVFLGVCKVFTCLTSVTGYIKAHICNNWFASMIGFSDTKSFCGSIVSCFSNPRSHVSHVNLWTGLCMRWTGLCGKSLWIVNVSRGLSKDRRQYVSEISRIVKGSPMCRKSLFFEAGPQKLAVRCH